MLAMPNAYWIGFMHYQHAIFCLNNLFHQNIHLHLSLIKHYFSPLILIGNYVGTL